MEKPLGKHPLRRMRRRWVGNIKMDLRRICCEDSTGSGSCPMADFFNSHVEPYGSAAT
jgi:hypothetical protein